MGSIFLNSNQAKEAFSPVAILRIITNYAFFGIIWVSASDLFVFLHGGETLQDAVLSMLKGFAFVAVSAVLLHSIIRKSFRDTFHERDAYRERLRDLSLHANDIVFLVSENGQILEANDRAVTAYGYSIEELCTKGIIDLVIERSNFRNRWDLMLQNGSLRSETIHLRADGSTFPVEFSSRRFEAGGRILVHSVIRDITERHEAEREILKLKDAYAALFQTNQCIAQCCDQQQLFQRTCEIAVDRTHLKLAWIGIADVTSGMVVPVAKAGPASDYVTGLKVSMIKESRFSTGIGGRAMLSGRPVVVNELWKTDGYQPWTEKLREHDIQSWAAYPIRQSGNSVGVLMLYSDDPQFFTDELSSLLEGMADDISLALDRMAHESIQAELHAELNKLKKAVEQSPVTVIITDRLGDIQYVNPAFTISSGYSFEEVLGKNPRILKSGESSQQTYREMWTRLLGGESWVGEFHNKRKNGTFYWEEAVISPVKDLRGEITNFIAVKQDVTARREAEAKALFLAFHDSLTELPNRSLAKIKAVEVMRDADSVRGKAAILCIDVDNLKRVNDCLGHRAGDGVLQALVHRFKSFVHECELLFRVSGDEFLVVVANLQDQQSIATIAQQVRNSLAAPIEIDGLELPTSVSIGAAIYPDNGQDFEELYRQANLAMYSAKEEGRDSFRIYSKSMETDAHEYIAVVNGLRKALKREEFVMHYQPQIHLESGRISAVEALLRWNRPKHGLILPGRFISIAEDCGLIFEIGEWVINEVCRQARKWRDQGLSNLRIAVNISPLQLRRESLKAVIASSLNEFKLGPEVLELELTESALVHSSKDVAAYLKLLRNQGVSIALDDFGTDYSNFTYLKNFDLDRLKIDQSFVKNLSTKNKGDVAIVRSIVQLARNFGLQTIAEGVETEEALRVIRRSGCDHAQGFLLASPMRADAVQDFIDLRNGSLDSQSWRPPTSEQQALVEKGCEKFIAELKLDQ